MHYHCEIIIPPTDDIEESIKAILAPFDENGKDEDGDRNSYAFWDYYVVGGRWAGTKAKAKLDKAKLEEFYAWLQAEKITVSGVVAGKQSLRPADQIPKVDVKWREMFGGTGPCPIFDHSPETIDGDICRLTDVPADMTCSRVIIGGPSWRDDGTLEAKSMISDSMYNGVDWIDTAWDKTLPAALALHRKRFEHSKPEYREKVMPDDNWLVVTVDYHS